MFRKSLSVLVLALAFPVAGDSIAAPLPTMPETQKVDEEGWNDSKPIKRRPPSYPRKAANNGQEGWVHLRFTITDRGTVDDVEVVQSYPPGVL